MTNQQAPEALRPIARYKIGYHTDEWGMRSSTPSGIPDRAGAWVRYEDHIAALVEAQQPAPSAAVALSDDLRDRLVAISEAVADQDDRAAQAMLREILAAPQTSPTPQADSQPAPAAVAGPSEAVAYLDIGAGGYLDLGTDMTDEALSRLPKGRHALVIAGTYGIDGYIAAPTTQPAPQPSPASQGDALDAEQHEMDARHAAIYRWMLSHVADVLSIFDNWFADEEADTDELHDALAARAAQKGGA